MAIITGCISLLGTIITVFASSKKQSQEYSVNNAVIQQKIEELTKTVDKHNNVIERVYQLESNEHTLFKYKDDLQKRIEQLENNK